ncbi:MAG: hypothetical protein ACTSUC_04190 [Promethearchaeota archaeon]
MPDYNEILEYFEINYLLYDKIEEDNIGYVLLLTYDSLEDLQEHFLMENGFEKIKSDLWLKQIDGIDEVPPDEFEKIKKYYSDQRISRNLRHIYYKRKEEIENLWDDINKMIYEINNCTYMKYNSELFKSNFKTLYSAINLKGKVITNFVEFEDFCKNLSIFTHESIIEPLHEMMDKGLLPEIEENAAPNKAALTKYFQDVEYYKYIKTFRDTFSHIPGQRSQSEREEAFEKMKEIFLNLIGFEYPKKGDDYFFAQKRILELCLDFLLVVKEIFLGK